MTGTLINAGLVVLGSAIGLLIRSSLPDRFIQIVFQGIGLFTLGLGSFLIMEAENFLLIVFSLVLGGLLGEALSLEDRTESVLNKLQNRFTGPNFSKGLLSAFFLFCLGSFTILGAFEEGLTGSYKLLLTKSILDGFSSVALAAGLGIGVLFSVVPLLLYQGGLTFLAAYMAPYLNESIQHDISALGGILILGLGLKILEIKELKLLNLLPGIILIVPLYYLFQIIPWLN